MVFLTKGMAVFAYRTTIRIKFCNEKYENCYIHFVTQNPSCSSPLEINPEYRFSVKSAFLQHYVTSTREMLSTVSSSSLHKNTHFLFAEEKVIMPLGIISC